MKRLWLKSPCCWGLLRSLSPISLTNNNPHSSPAALQLQCPSQIKTLKDGTSDNKMRYFSVACFMGLKYRANYPLPSRKSGINSVWIGALINGLHSLASLGRFAAFAAAQAVWNFNTIIKVYLCVDTHSFAVLFSFPIIDKSLERIDERKHKTKNIQIN